MIISVWHNSATGETKRFTCPNRRVANSINGLRFGWRTQDCNWRLYDTSSGGGWYAASSGEPWRYTHSPDGPAIILLQPMA